MAMQRINLPSDLRLQLEGLTKKIRNRIIRKGLRRWSIVVRALIRSNLYIDDAELKRNIKTKIKSYRRGSKIWIGVGITDNGTAPKTNPGLRVAMYEGGYRPYPKGRPTNRKGKDWRSGLKRIVAPKKINVTRFMSKAQDQSKSLIIPSIKEELQSVIRNASQKGNDV